MKLIVWPHVSGKFSDITYLGTSGIFRESQKPSENRVSIKIQQNPWLKRLRREKTAHWISIGPWWLLSKIQWGSRAKPVGRRVTVLGSDNKVEEMAYGLCLKKYL